MAIFLKWIALDILLILFPLRMENNENVGQWEQLICYKGFFFMFYTYFLL